MTYYFFVTDLKGVTKMVHFFKYTAMALIGLMLAACSSSPKPPPEPNMRKLVDVNKTYPAELYRADAANNGE
ncbi:conjugal transfer protein TraF [Klebsiella pneumoniae]